MFHLSRCNSNKCVLLKISKGRNDNFKSIIFYTNNFDPGWFFNSIFAKNKCSKKLKSCVENEHEYLVYNFNNYPEYVITTTTKTFNKEKKKSFNFFTSNEHRCCFVKFCWYKAVFATAGISICIWEIRIASRIRINSCSLLLRMNSLVSGCISKTFASKELDIEEAWIKIKNC